MNIVAAVLTLGILGAVFGLVLAIASKVFEVKKDPREEEILSLLAGANCGGCGFPGCGGHCQDYGHGSSHRRAGGCVRALHRRRKREEAV